MLQDIVAIAMLPRARRLQVASVLGWPPMPPLLPLPSVLHSCLWASPKICKGRGCWKTAFAEGHVSAVRVPWSLLCQSACSIGWGATVSTVSSCTRKRIWGFTASPFYPMPFQLLLHFKAVFLRALGPATSPSSEKMTMTKALKISLKCFLHS